MSCLSLSLSLSVFFPLSLSLFFSPLFVCLFFPSLRLRFSVLMTVYYVVSCTLSLYYSLTLFFTFSFSNFVFHIFSQRLGPSLLALSFYFSLSLIYFSDPELWIRVAIHRIRPLRKKENNGSGSDP